MTPIRTLESNRWRGAAYHLLTTGQEEEREMQTTDRLAVLERRVAELERELGLRARPDAPPPPPPSVGLAVGRTAAQTAGRTLPPALPQRTPLEDLLGGRVLAWAGGVTVLAGIVLLFAVAVSRGWLGEGARTLAGGLFSLMLAMTGTWLREARGRTDAALAAAGAGFAGLVVTAVVATRVYELVGVGTGVALVLAAAAAATAAALRWDAPGLAALGLVGGLAAPVLVGAPTGGATTALLAVTAAAVALVCVARRWDWLGLTAFAVVTPQWAAYALDADTVEALFTILTFGAIGGAAAVGTRSQGLLALNAAAVTAAGAAVFGNDVAWLSYLAGAHAAAGAILLRRDRPLAVAALVLGVVLADVALADLLDGWTLAGAFAALAAAAALAARWLPSPVLVATAHAHLALAVGHVLVLDAPPLGAGTQALVSSLLAAGGLVLVVVGLLGDRRAVRAAGLAVLGAVLAKASLYDLRALTPIARVASLTGLGLLLLAGGYAWQRLRPATVEAGPSDE
jgi:uncharacterized membrane protein